MNRYWGLSGLLVVLLLLCTVEVAGGQTFNIMTENYPPYNYQQQGKLNGLSVEIVREICKRIDHPTEIEVLPWARAYKKAKTQPGQILFSTDRTRAREDLFKWVGPLVNYEIVFFAKQGTGIEINSLEEAKQVGRIGVGLNASGNKFLRNQGFNNLNPVARPPLNAKKLVKERIDLWYSGKISGIYRAKQMGVNPHQLQAVYTVKTGDLYIAFSKSTSEIVIKQWQEALESIKADGTYTRILNQYLN